MSRRRLDALPAGRAPLPDAGLGRGWEAAALLAIALLLLSFGLVTLYSASSVLALRQGLPDTFYAVRQAAGAGIGLAALLICARLPYHVWSKLSWPMLGATVLALLLLVVPGTGGLTYEANGARRWLDVGVRVQPSEFAKIAVIVWTASMAVRKVEHFKSLRRGLGPFFVIWGLVLVPVTLQPDLSTAFLIGVLGAVVVFAAGARLAHFVFVGLLLAPLAWSQLSIGFRAERMRVFLNPAADPAGAGFQVKQSLVALGSGGVTGVGFGEGRQKFGFLPEVHNDFIFASLGEEWGLLGVVLLLGLYVAVLLVGFRVAARAPDLFGELLAIGFTTLVGLQAFLHMAVGLGLVPTTGLSLPLVSYGRSNLIVTLVALGILVSVARTPPGAGTARA